ncbi:hypothetical protein SAMN05892877_102335 [Rhizobium subbaraonis]|uniref:Probable membrane transporter protein n=2 Tax=Rhizobium subbaraonis TaxID=908946 RepID=A0A285U2F0_9HYPH|nr:hypothetical protein SAMN05892877_102335 [Rhizobium subbaraonis]
MTVDPLILPAVAFITFAAAGFVKRVTGMGLPTVAMGLLGALISPLAAAGLLLVPSFVTNVWQLATGPGLGPLVRRFRSMMVAIVAGTLAGSAMLASGDTDATTKALGGVLVIYAGYTLLARQIRVPPMLERWLSPAAGLATGLVAGATGVFVIPAVPYLQSLELEKDELVQTLGLSFTVSTVALAAALIWRGAFRADNLVLSLLSVVPALAGMWVGQRVRDRVSPQTFRLFFLLGLALLGAEMVLRP